MDSLRTERLELVPLTSQNTPQMRAMWVLPQVRKHLWDGIEVSQDKAKEAARQSEEALEKRIGGLFLALVNGEVAGFCGFWPFFEPPRVELVVGLHPAHFKSGFAEEMGQAMLQLAFNTWGWDRVQASVDAGNPDFVNLLKKLEFSEDVDFTWLDTTYTRYMKRRE